MQKIHHPAVICKCKSFHSFTNYRYDTIRYCSSNIKDSEVKVKVNKTSKPNIFDNAMSDNLEELEDNLEFPSDMNESWARTKNYNDWKCDQEKHSYRPQIDPTVTSIFLFPGQGSQFVGMGKNLINIPSVKLLYEKANSILGYDLLNLCLNGPKSTLDKTVYCQPAIYVTSLAALYYLIENNPLAVENCVSAAGFSVGEFAALVFAGMLSFEDGLNIVKVRAESMQEASEMVPSGMMTVFLNAQSKVDFACHTAELYCKRKLGIEYPICRVANHLYTECKVIGGNLEALKFIETHRQEFGIKRCRYLPVSGAFHTKLMFPAVARFEESLEEVSWSDPIIPIHSNVTSHKISKKSIEKLLIQQLYNPVKWEQILHILYSRQQGIAFPKTFEVGPGKHLGAMLKLTNRKAYETYTPIDV